MVLNWIFIAFFLLGFLLACFKWLFTNEPPLFGVMTQDLFKMSKTAFEISLYLTGGMCFWLGIMRIAEKGGAVKILTKIIGPLFSKLFPGVPRNHPAMSAMLMNFAANMLGLDNAATPLGLKAMKELQTLNPQKNTATNAQIMFLVLNTSGLTLIPVSIMVLRSSKGAENPADIFLPILLATFCSSLAGLIIVSIIQKVKLYHPIVLAWLLGLTGLASGIYYYFDNLPKEQVELISSAWSGFIIFSIITIFITLAIKAKVNVYEEFIEGAKEGFKVAIMIIPYLVAILSAIAVFRAAGGIEIIMDGIKFTFAKLSIQTDFVEALPTALVRPFSGSGARAMMVDAINTHGVDSFVARLASSFQGTTETTFYTIAVYFGAVNIRKTRYTAPCGLFADFVGMISAIVICYSFFG